MWPSVVVHEHWPVSQCMIVEKGGLHVERAFCHGIFGLSDYHQEHTSPTYSQRKNNPRQLHPHPQKQLCPKCGCPEMKCFVGAKPLHDRR